MITQLVVRLSLILGWQGREAGSFLLQRKEEGILSIVTLMMWGRGAEEGAFSLSVPIIWVGDAQ